jgi:sugar lactone lactonase YvrE
MRRVLNGGGSRRGRVAAACWLLAVLVLVGCVEPPPPALPAGAVTTLAGMSGTWGSEDGTATEARFWGPFGLAVAPDGSVYVADTMNNTVRRIGPGGVTTTVAGTGALGSNDGPADQASFKRPTGIAVDPAGNVFIADTANAAIRRLSPAGIVTTVAGMPGVYGRDDGTGSGARFSQPNGLASDRQGNIYVADSGNVAIRRIDPSGVVTTIAGRMGASGTTDGPVDVATFASPYWVTVDDHDNVYVSDSNSYTIRKITPEGMVTTIAGKANSAGSIDGPQSTARFGTASQTAVDADGTLYVADQSNNTIRRIAPNGDVTTLAGTAPLYGTIDAFGPTARFAYPTGLALDRTSHTLYVADNGTHTLRAIT